MCALPPTAAGTGMRASVNYGNMLADPERLQHMVQHVVDLYDANRNGTIEFEEYRTVGVGGGDALPLLSVFTVVVGVCVCVCVHHLTLRCGCCCVHSSRCVVIMCASAFDFDPSPRVEWFCVCVDHLLCGCVWMYHSLSCVCCVHVSV